MFECIVGGVSNRIMAAAYKSQWEKLLGNWISEAQRGFIPGRSMLANVVDLEHKAMMTSLAESRGLLLLIDFKAAFPSIARDFMWHPVTKRCAMVDGESRCRCALLPGLIWGFRESDHWGALHS